MVGLIEAGEAGGILSGVLERLASLIEAQNKIKGQIKRFLTSNYDDRFIENVQLFERVKHITVFDGEFFTFW